MTFMIIQLLILFIWILAFILLITSNKKLAILLGAIGAFLMVVELSSVIFSNALFDYKYYVHLNFNNATKMSGAFLKQSIIIVLCFFIFLTGLFYSFKLLNVKLKFKKLIALLTFVVCTGFMSVDEGVIKNIYEISSIHFAKNKAFEDSLNELGLEDYVHKINTESKSGKNIILIMLESYEASFLSDKLAHLSTNTRQLAEEMNYYNMKPAGGSDFTIGAVYTYLTGFPCFFKNHGNDVFGNSIEIKVNSISNALKKAGYEQRYLLGNPDFGGTRKMSNLLEVDIRSEEDYDPKYKLDYWGLHDIDLFELAKKEILELSSKNEPYAFYLSTINTHAHDGIFDSRALKEIPIQKSQLELMAGSLDLLLGRFVKFLKEEGVLENTALYIVPDHLLMGNSARVISDFEEERNLFLITNTSPDSYAMEEDIYQIDMPRIILEGAEIETNLKFLADKIQGDKGKFIKENKLKLTQLNESSLTAFDSKKQSQTDGLELAKSKDVVSITSVPWTADNVGKESSLFVGEKEYKAGRGVNLLVYDEATNAYDHEIYDTYEQKNQIDSLLNRLTFLIENKQYFLAMIHDSAGDEMVSYFPKFKKIGLEKLGRVPNRKAYIAVSNCGISSELSKRRVLEVKLPFKPFKSSRTREEIQRQANDPNRFIAHAGGIIEGKTYTNSLEALNASYKKGFRLFELDIIKTSDGEFVAAHDWENWQKRTGYMGKTPVDLATFKKHKFDGFTTLGMDDINKWFSDHPDAILVTDKVKNAKGFAAKFVDKNRLMMELFSWNEFEEAQKVGIKAPIATEVLWAGLGGDKLKALQNRKVKHLAVSRRTIDKNKEHFKEILEAGIKVYGFHVNFDDLKDEAFMAREAFDYCYGMYADDWRF